MIRTSLIASARRSATRRAFTLIELLVVIAIISLLVSILLPSLQLAKDLAKDVACRTNLSAIGRTVHLYASENNGDSMPGTWFPTYPGSSTKRWMQFARTYYGLQEKTHEVFDLAICPHDPRQGQPQDRSDYPLYYLTSYASNRLTSDYFLQMYPNSSRYKPLAPYVETKVESINNAGNVICFSDFAVVSTNTVFVEYTEWTLKDIPLDRHGGDTNIVFWDGHVDPVSIGSLGDGDENFSCWFPAKTPSD